MADFDQLYMSGLHAVQCLAVGVPGNRGHNGIGPLVGALDVASKGGLRCSILDSRAAQGVNGRAQDVELSWVSW